MTHTPLSFAWSVSNEEKTFYDIVTRRLCDDCVTTTVAADDVIDDATEADSSLTRSSMETMGPLDPENAVKLGLVRLGQVRHFLQWTSYQK